eukprot:TRINITY_DN10527_c0_g1_i1.p1 TRINITY_DN10527_c0_g1~~TRINITY_DN10527_c0_g1_i1.p1  ORF type:complete len:526 (+),score=72.06 TRINITY_DN10527_c0_g1_i1:928-2505(+)
MSSSSVEKEKLAVCIKCKESKRGLSLCIGCKETDFFCSTCYNLYPLHKPSHKQYSKHISKDTFDKVSESLEYIFDSSQLVEDYSVNNFIRLGINDAQIKPGPKFVKIASNDYFSTKEDQEDRYLSIGSFIGGSGIGKSTLSRILCVLNQDPKNKPIPGDILESLSTSSDINAYKAILNDENDSFLLIDSEGTGGSLLLEGIKKKIKDETQLRIWESKKKKCVEKAYPRMLYLFSEVIVYVFRGALKEHLSIINPLKDYSKIAAANSVNMNFQPFLILVYNMVLEEEVAGKWNEHDITLIGEKFASTLAMYYKEPKVVFIPQWGTNKVLCARQIETLNKMIRTRLLEAHEIKKSNHLLIPKEKMLASMNKVSRLMSMNPGEVVNFTELSIKETSVHLLDRIAKFFSSAYYELIKNNYDGDPLEKALQITAEQTTYCLVNILEGDDVIHKALVVSGKLNDKQWYQRRVRGILSAVGDLVCCGQRRLCQLWSPLSFVAKSDLLSSSYSLVAFTHPSTVYCLSVFCGAF